MPKAVMESWLTRLYWMYLCVLTFGPRDSYGQLSCDKMTACSCEGAAFPRIDVSGVLDQTISTPVQDPDKPNKYEYFLNFCNGRKCENDYGVGGGQNAAVCERQIDGQQNVSVKLGDVRQHTWQVFNNNTFTVLFAGGDTPGNNGDGSRSAMLYVFVVAKAHPSVNPINTVNYVEERISGDNKNDHVYVFEIYVTSWYDPTPATPSPAKQFYQLFLIIFLSLVGVIGACAILICSACCCLFYYQRKTAYGYSSINDGGGRQYT